MKKWYIIFVCIILSSCKQQNDPLKQIILEDEYWHLNATYFPLHLSLYGEMERDTIHVIASTRDLANDINISIIPNEIFPKLLYNEIINNDGCINVDKNTFDEYRTYCIIEANSKIDSIYVQNGISGILDYAVDEYGRLIKLGKEGDYIIYLCFQHGIYFYNPYNEPETYVVPATFKKAE